MNFKRSKWVAVLVALVIGSLSASAAALSEGKPAPKIEISKWVQGDAVTNFEAGKVYVVEFWATWCPPCRESIPHLNELHKKFKDKGVVVIGVDAGETLAKVAPFVKQMGDKMTYRVGLDTPDEKDPTRSKTSMNWMEAADINSIPTAFVVDKKGTVVFIGHPMELTETIIEGVVDGSFDAEKSLAMHKKAVQQQEDLKKVAVQFEAAMQDKQWDKANAALDEIAKLMPEEKKPAVGFMRLRILLNRGDAKGASAMATQLSEQYKTDAPLLNAMAWELVTETGVTDRDLPLAEKLAAKANELTGSKEPQLLDTYARVLFMAGKKDQAIEYETKAIALVDGELKALLEKRLESYKAGKLPPVEG